MKRKLFKMVFRGAEDTINEDLSKSPASAEDVIAAMRFLNETSEICITICEYEIKEDGSAIEI